MSTPPALRALGRRIRLGMIGGAPGSFIGEVHRIAARMDNCYDVVCGVLSSKPEKAAAAGAEVGFTPDRCYTSVDIMLAAEARRPDKIDAVCIATPNDTHFEYSMAALRAGLHVICDKPITLTLAQAEELAATVGKTGLTFCLTHNYTGYPLVRQARAMVQAGDLGDIRLVQVEYVQGGRAKEVPFDPNARHAWKMDPAKGGESLVMGDIGTHAHNLARFITGLEVERVAASVGAIVPGRKVHDYAGAHLELQGGARGVLWVTQAAAGIENSLKIRVSGSRGSIEWWQEVPQQLHVYPIDGPAQLLTPNGPGLHPRAARVSRIVKGHPEGYLEGFANVYRDAAESIAAALTGTKPDPDYLDYPTHIDGLRGMQFVEAVISSGKTGGAWTGLPTL